jgi:hypothetical protein
MKVKIDVVMMFFKVIYLKSIIVIHDTYTLKALYFLNTFTAPKNFLPNFL